MLHAFHSVQIAHSLRPVVRIIVRDALTLSQQQLTATLRHAVDVRVALHHIHPAFVGEIAATLSDWHARNGRRAVRRFRRYRDESLGQRRDILRFGIVVRIVVRIVDEHSEAGAAEERAVVVVDERFGQHRQACLVAAGGHFAWRPRNAVDQFAAGIFA